MKFTMLGQKTYKDHNGNEISADEIHAIAPYKYVADGFYHWQCGACGKEHASRACGWAVAGQVLKCQPSDYSTGGSSYGCGKMSLLVKTNTVDIDAALSQKNQLDEREKEIVKKEKVLGEYIHKEKWGKMVALFRQMSVWQHKFSLEIHNLTQHLPL